MNRFRCQYQKGDICVTEHFESDAPISSSRIMLSKRGKYENGVESRTGSAKDS